LKNNPPKSTKRGGARPGAGRPKGVQNQLTRDVKEMILSALEAKGGQDYLARQADDNPVAFMSLVGRILPLQVNADMKADVTLRPVGRRIIDAGGN
jgi:hypothetical protein